MVNFRVIAVATFFEPSSTRSAAAEFAGIPEKTALGTNWHGADRCRHRACYWWYVDIIVGIQTSYFKEH